MLFFKSEGKIFENTFKLSNQAINLGNRITQD